MQIVIDIPDWLVSKINDKNYEELIWWYDATLYRAILEGIPLPKGHGRLIDAEALHKAMYQRAFETDGDTMWQSGCWVRYRAIEQVQDSQPTVVEAEQ